MKKTLLILAVFLLPMMSVLAFARDVGVGFNWFYEVSKLPTGVTMDQAYANTDKIVVYQSNDMAVTWQKIKEFPMTGFPLPAPVAGWPITFNIALTDGVKYNLHFATTSVNKLGVESAKSNYLPVTVDLTTAAVVVTPTIKTITIIIVTP